MKRMLFAVAALLVAVSAMFVVADYATQPASLIATAEAAEKPRPAQSSGGVVMWLVSFVPGTNIIWHQTPFVAQVAPGESIEKIRGDLERASGVHDLTLPRGETAKKMQDNAVAEFNEFFESTPNAMGILEERANRKRERLLGQVPDTSTEARPGLISDDPFIDPTPTPGGGPGGGGWTCPCYFGDPCPQGCCLTRLFGTCIVAACIDCVPR